jgi:quercetin dioxygenase-like cupin family protein
MPKFSKDSLPIKDYGPVEEGEAVVDGWAIDFTTFKADIDGTPMLKGLPGDHCNCPHWGYVLKGSFTFRFPDHDEVVEAGEAFYVGPGHIPVITAGTEVVMFSPAEELHETAQAIERNMAAMQ